MVTSATDGWFTAEPQRAALLRAAMRLELPIVAFDMDGADLAWMGEHPGKIGAWPSTSSSASSSTSLLPAS